jgi:hypothetical protein
LDLQNAKELKHHSCHKCQWYGVHSFECSSMTYNELVLNP